MSPGTRTAVAREVIAAVALEEFLRYGYEATSLANVAASADVPVEDVAHHFTDKATLLRIHVEDAFDDLARTLAAIPITAAPDSHQQHDTICALVDTLLRHRSAIALMSRFTTEHTVLNVGQRAQLLHYQVGVRVGGAAFDTDPVTRVKIVACISAITGAMDSRIPLPLDSPAERDALVAVAAAILAS